MELKPGFKQTEVGVIPEDWDVKLLPDVLRFRSGKAHEQFISDTGSYICVNSKFISTGGSVRKYSSANFSPARKGDVLMVMSDLPNGRALAKAYFVEADNIYAVNQRVCALTAYRDNPKYLFYILNRNPYFLSFDDGVSQTHLLNRVFQKCPIPLPQSTKEQSSIAEALSDVDSLLYDLDQLVTKKRAIKQAAMQDLLTGKRRLPGFEGEWEVKRLGDLAEIKSGGTPSTSQPAFWDGGIPWCTPTDITALDGRKYLTTTARTISPAGLQGSSAETIPPYSLIMTTRATIGECAINAFPMTTNQGFKNIVPNSSVGTEFLYYLMTTQKQRLVSLCGGSTFLEIGKKELNAYEIRLPLNRDEQDAIASMLSGMDEELQALEANLSKVGNLKQGMMQQLLTGKVRLK
jgi:type I restriction enzyme S subunit